MTALSIERLTPQMDREAVPHTLSAPMAAGAKCFGGGMVALAAGVAQPPGGGARQVIAGRAERTADNTGLAAGATLVEIRQGCFKYGNSASVDAIVAANQGQLCYAVDDQTVALTSSNGSRSIAGRIVQVDTDGVWVEIGLCVIDPGITPSAVNARCRLVTTANDTLAGLAARDGVTPLAGDRVLVVGQTIGANNGVYVAAAGAWALAPDWVQGMVTAGMTFDVSEGTLWANSAWRITAVETVAGGPITVGTTDPLFYPRIHKGTGAVGTPVTALYVLATNAALTLVDTTAAAAVKGVLVAGRGTGTLTLTGTGTDAVNYGVINF